MNCIINTSIVTSIFPTAWKHALVVPSSKTDNFRFISLLPIVSKTLEKAVSVQLTQLSESNKLPSNTQQLPFKIINRNCTSCHYR